MSYIHIATPVWPKECQPCWGMALKFVPFHFLSPGSNRRTYLQVLVGLHIKQLLQDFSCPITLGQWETCDWTKGRQSEELRRDRERGGDGGGSQEEREPEWCYQKVRIIGLKLYD